MIIRKLRLKRGWSQEQLAQVTGLNVRTIQRLERGQNPSLETKKSLAAVFEVDISTFELPTENSIQGESKMTESDNSLSEQSKPIETIQADEKEAIEYAKGVKEFLTHLFFFLVFIPVIVFKKGLYEPTFNWLILGWAIGLVIHGLNAFEKLNFFKVDWEKKIAERKLGRKL
ncbi:helix-turn-helix domain-containing protein [Kangiella sp. HZ709]|uniref:helix-turn-helix domain-containing protein n=1 Tax=Kangiella sp. HZ709 TaxID=2666328 RepID=UPI0012AFEBE8|nr:helix-turn-helix domain-containing protein [Kangiella sp. HZ709]MRX28314.1 helix-turn-helix domain-containing protein [Kangiella sp. HZ709]